MRVLVVEDEADLSRQVATALRGGGYAVDVATDGVDGHHRGDTQDYDAVVLDLGLPGLDGLSVLARWRDAQRTMPVLVLTARGSWRDKVTGLRAGADDYLAKPFEMEELLARIEALIRRSAGRASPLLRCGDVEIDTASQQVTRGGRRVDLTALEYRMLAYLMHNAGRVISKTELTEHLYEQDFDRDSNVIEVLVNRLRRKLGAGLVRTRRGLGYQVGDADAPR